MSAVTHYEFYACEPSESDTQGDSALACGRDWAEKTTSSKTDTTCKQCLKELGKESAPQAKILPPLP